jgi:hypothetical protein
MLIKQALRPQQASAASYQNQSAKTTTVATDNPTQRPPQA